MGANFQTMTLPGTTSRDEVTKTFSKVQDRDRSQNDSQYAGGFGMCSATTDITFTLDGRPKLIWLDVARNGITHLPSSMILAKARIG